MIRLNENVYLEAEKRGCGPLETFLLGQRLAMWPLFQKDMGTQVESLKKLAESAVGGLLSRSGIKDSAVQVVSLNLVFARSGRADRRIDYKSLCELV